MNLSLKPIESPRIADAASEHSGFAFVGNSLGFAAAICSSSATDYELIELPGLPGIMVTPKPLFGLKAQHIEKAQSSIPDSSGNLDAFMSVLLPRLSAIVRPEARKVQAKRVKDIAFLAAAYARGMFEKTDDIAYSTDVRSTYLGDRGPWALKNTVSDQTLRLHYGHTVDHAIDCCFSGVEVSNSDRRLIEAYVFDELREQPSQESDSVAIFWLSGGQRVPAFAQLMMDGFIADKLKADYEPWGPAHIRDGEGLVLCRSSRPSSVNAKRDSVYEYASALNRGQLHCNLGAVGPDKLGLLMDEAIGVQDYHVSWAPGNEGLEPAPDGFNEATPEALLEVAIVLAQAKLGPRSIGDEQNIVSTFTAAR